MRRHSAGDLITTCPGCCCRVGRRLMRALLHNEVGLVSHRRAWAGPNKPHPSLLALYRLPHRVQNWDGALVQVQPPACSVPEAQNQMLHRVQTWDGLAHVWPPFSSKKKQKKKEKKQRSSLCLEAGADVSEARLLCA